MTKPLVFMFSGQGSHYYQMGQGLYEGNSLFSSWMQKADAIYQDLVGLSVIKELYHSQKKRSDLFARTLLTHPAIFMIEHALAQVVLSQGITPNYVLETSLGEFAAAVVSGILSFETALQAVIKQAQIIEETCRPGSMLAIFQPPPSYYNHPLFQNNGELAAINFASHFVVSGEQEAITRVETSLKDQQTSYQILPVSHGFHASSIDRAAPQFLQFMDQQTLKPPMIPLISCAYAKSLATVSSTHFWEVIRKPIQFQATIQALETTNNYIYLDLGPSGTLATFIKYNLTSQSPSKGVATLIPFNSHIFSFTDLRNELSL